MKGRNNKPLLRFSEFDSEWKESRLGELCSHFKSGSGITSENISEDGDFPVYGGNGLRGFTNSFTHDGFYLLIGRQGALCGNINRVKGKSYISEHAIVVCANESSNTEWLAQKLDDLNLNRLSESSAQPGLAVNKLLRLKLLVPSGFEQQKIADFLSTVDKKTQLLTRKKGILEEYKKGVMQKIFSQDIRFKDENGEDFPEWEERSMGDLLFFITTNSFSRNDLTFDKGSIKNIHYGDIHTKFKSNYRSVDEKTPFLKADIQISKYDSDNFCQQGDLIIADASEDYSDIGKAIEIIAISEDKILAGLHTIHVRDKSVKMYVGFKGYLFQSYAIRKQMMKMAQGISVLGISKKSIEKIEVQLPHFEEQKKIVGFLTSIDKKIQSVQSQITHSLTFKKGLLQQMFV